MFINTYYSANMGSLILIKYSHKHQNQLILAENINTSCFNENNNFNNIVELKIAIKSRLCSIDYQQIL